MMVVDTEGYYGDVGKVCGGWERLLLVGTDHHIRKTWLCWAFFFFFFFRASELHTQMVRTVTDGLICSAIQLRVWRKTQMRHQGLYY